MIYVEIGYSYEVHTDLVSDFDRERVEDLLNQLEALNCIVSN